MALTRIFWVKIQVELEQERQQSKGIVVQAIFNLTNLVDDLHLIEKAQRA